MRRKIVRLVLATTLALGLAAPAAAQEPTPSEQAAVQAYREGAFSRAVALYTKALSETTDPVHRAQLHVRIAWTLFALGRESEVPTHLRAALLEDPGLELVPDYYTQEFLDLFQKVKNEPPRGGGAGTVPDTELETRLAAIQASLDSGENLEQALAEVELLLESHPDDGRLLPLKVALLRSLGRTEEAARAEQLLLAATGGASAPVEPVDTGASVPELILRANRLLDEGDVETSLQLLRTAVARQPSNVAALELLAEAATRAGNWDEAEFALKSALSYQRDNLELELRLGEVYLAMGDTSAARDVFRSLTEKQPHSDRAWAALGLLDARLGRTDRAMEELAKAIQENPLLPEVQLAYGELLLLHGDPERALTALRSASNLLHDDAQVEARLGQALLARGEPAAALQHLRTAITAGFDPPDVLRSFVLVLVENGLLAEAERTLESANLGPDGWSDLLRGLILLEREEPGTALGLLREEAKRHPNDPRVLNLVGVALYRDRRFADAVPVLERAVELAPDDQVLAENLRLARAAAAAEALREDALPAEAVPSALPPR